MASIAPRPSAHAAQAASTWFRHTMPGLAGLPWARSAPSNVFKLATCTSLKSGFLLRYTRPACPDLHRAACPSPPRAFLLLPFCINSRISLAFSLRNLKSNSRIPLIDFLTPIHPTTRLIYLPIPSPLTARFSSVFIGRSAVSWSTNVVPRCNSLHPISPPVLRTWISNGHDATIHAFSVL
jgi:hypothetical protein